MSLPLDPRHEQPGTYVVQDRSNQDEFTRVLLQDQMLTAAMGGALPEQTDPLIFRRVLDVGCGSGDWLLEVAKANPTATLLVGVDVNQRMLQHARAQAAARQEETRVEFHVMDALRMLEFPPAFFDLVNQRLGSSFLRTWDWDKLLHEYRRVARPGGVIRITESDMITQSSSPAFLRFNQVVFQALNQAGYFFTPESDGVTRHLMRLLQQYGLQQVKSRAHLMDYRAGTPQWQLYYEDTERASRTLLPFLQKWSRVPEDYQTLCQQMLSEMRQPEFTATWRALTVWGKNPG